MTQTAKLSFLAELNLSPLERRPTNGIQSGRHEVEKRSITQDEISRIITWVGAVSQSASSISVEFIPDDHAH